MSIRVDAVGDYLERATISPPFSICGWCYMVNDRNDYSTIFAIDIDQQTVGAGTGRSLSLQTDNDGVTLALWDNTAYVGARTLTPGQWFFWAMVFSSNTSAIWYHANLGDLSLYVSPTATTSNASNQYHHLMNNAYSEWFDGRQAYIKHWSVAKTEAQLTSEMLTIRPMSLSSVYLFTPTFPGSGIRVRDYSGNGRNWTEGGTLTDEDPPPISWGAGEEEVGQIITPPVSGGQPIQLRGLNIPGMRQWQPGRR